MKIKWDHVVDQLMNSNQYSQCLPASFTDEVDTMHYLSNGRQNGTNRELHRWLTGLPSVLPTGEDLSNDVRTKANELFKDKKSNHLVLDTYSKAIATAPRGSRAMALGYANRAIILIRLGRYCEAFDDCQLALDGDYPADKRLKVYFRQAECVESLDEPHRLGSIIEGISKVSDTTVLSKNEQKKMQMLSAKYATAEKCTVEMAHTEPETESCYEPSVELQFHYTVGRYAVAKKKITRNDLIATETAVSFVPVYDPDSRSTFTSNDCQKCARVNVIPYVCATCGRACYCSPQCRETHQSVHRFECYGYQISLWRNIGIAHLGLRCLLDGFGTIRDEIIKADSAQVCFQRLTKLTSDEENDLGQYGKVFRLVTNFEKMEQDDMVQYALTGLMLSNYLTECTEFVSAHGLQQPGTMPASELGILLAALIMRHIGQLVCNGHAISELRASPYAGAVDLIREDSFLPAAGLLHLYLRSSRVFTAIFPLISMFNHSCNPNISNQFERATLKVYAAACIESGREITNCYGPHYRLMDRDTRQMHLRQQYCFDCNCIPCQGRDRIYYDEFNQVRCPHCTVHFGLEEDFEGSKPLRCKTCSRNYGTELRELLRQEQTKPTQDAKEIIRRTSALYDWCTKLFVGSNQTKAGILEDILYRYTQHAISCRALLLFLRKIALEFIEIRSKQYGFRSLEYLTGCFYLLDIWAMLYLDSGKVPVQLKSEEYGVLENLRHDALNIVGEDTRRLISEYMRQSVNLDENP